MNGEAKIDRNRSRVIIGQYQKWISLKQALIFSKRIHINKFETKPFGIG